MIVASNVKGYYPTPKSLLAKIDADFAELLNELKGKISVLEPSAGKGDIVDYLKDCQKKGYRASFYYEENKSSNFCWYGDIEIDCIEINPELRYVLTGKEYRVVHDNFMSFTSRKRYDLIIMNPPFADGDKHLLKAIEMQEKYGGTIICILNAETVRNPYCHSRQALLSKLEKYGATTKFYTDGFNTDDTERKTDVEVVVIGLRIPAPENLFFSSIFDKLDKSEKNFIFELEDESENTEIIHDGLDFISSYVKQFNEEIDAGIAFLTEYQAFIQTKRLRYEFKDEDGEDKYGDELQLSVRGNAFGPESINKYVQAIRHKYWHTLFWHPQFSGKLTSKMRDELYKNVEKMEDYDVTVHNAMELLADIRSKTLQGIEESIMGLFEKFSSQYSYIDQSSNNIHYYNGWKTNKAHKVNKKVIIPMYGVWDSWRWGGKTEWRLREWEATGTLLDMAKALDFIADGTYKSIDTGRNMEHQIHVNFERGITSNIQTKYFTLTFYKKGTCHIVFRDEELLEKFNLYAGKQKGWLPPFYGKKAYADMDEEEKDLVKEFSGTEKAYNKIYENQAKYLVDSGQMLMIAESREA